MLRTLTLKTLWPRSCRALLAAGLLLAGCRHADAQSAAAPRQAVATTPTVSVASLRVPPKAWDHYQKAIVAAKAHRSDECRRELDKALAIDTEFAEAYVLRSAQEIDAHDFGPALADASRARQLNAGARGLTLIFAEYYNGIHDFRNALLLLENVPGSEAERWEVKYETGVAEVGLRDTEAALHWSDVALASAPASFAAAHLLRANALNLAERPAEAAAELEKYLASPGPQPLRTQALAALAATQRKATLTDSPTIASR